MPWASTTSSTTTISPLNPPRRSLSALSLSSILSFDLAPQPLGEVNLFFLLFFPESLFHSTESFFSRSLLPNLDFGATAAYLHCLVNPDLSPHFITGNRHFSSSRHCRPKSAKFRSLCETLGTLNPCRGGSVVDIFQWPQGTPSSPSRMPARSPPSGHLCRPFAVCELHCFARLIFRICPQACLWLSSTVHSCFPDAPTWGY